MKKAIGIAYGLLFLLDGLFRYFALSENRSYNNENVQADCDDAGEFVCHVEPQAKLNLVFFPIHTFILVPYPPAAKLCRNKLPGSFLFALIACDSRC